MLDLMTGASGPVLAVTQGRPAFLGTKHVVSSTHYLATMAGLRMFALGGNAADAGVAAGIALNVLERHLTDFGGVAPIMFFRPGNGPPSNAQLPFGSDRLPHGRRRISTHSPAKCGLGSCGNGGTVLHCGGILEGNLDRFLRKGSNFLRPVHQELNDRHSPYWTVTAVRIFPSLPCIWHVTSTGHVPAGVPGGMRRLQLTIP